MNGGISDTNTTPTDQNNDPAALLGALMSSPENVGASSGTPRDGIFGYGYYDDVTGSFTKADRPAVTPPVVVEPPTPPVVPPVPPVVPPVVPPPRKKIVPGEGSVNEDARKRGEMLSAFLASFQAAYQRKNPNFNFTRNPRLAKGLGLPWSGDLGR